MAVAAAIDCSARHRPRQRSTASSSPRPRTRSRRSRARRSSPRRSTCAATCSPPTSATRCAPARPRCAPALDAVKAGSRQARAGASPATAAHGARRARRSSATSATAPRRFLVGSDDVIAELASAHAVADEIIDVWRTDGDPFVQHVGGSLRRRARLPRQHGRGGEGPARRRPASRPRTSPRRSLYGPDARSHASVAKQLGFDAKTQVQDPLFGQLGNTGAAFAPMLLVAALESAKPGDTLLVASYGDGAEALAARDHRRRSSGSTRRRGVRWHLERRGELGDYDKYLRFRQPRARPSSIAAPAPASRRPMHFRDRDEDISFHGQRCRKCGQEQFPLPARLLHLLRARTSSTRCASRTASARCCRFTFDFFAGSPDPPLIVASIEVEGGARSTCR